MSNVLWFVADALRYDYARKLHFLQEWAASGAVCENHFSMAHCSDPNFLSLLTGFGPEQHEVLTQLETSASAGKPVTYPAYSGIQVWLKKQFGHRCLMFGPTEPSIYRWAFDVVIPAGRKDKTEHLGGIQEFMDESKQMGKPWFAMVRTMDCHAPYFGGTYRKGTRHTDELIAELFPWIEANHPDTLIAFFSDHGESLGEHGMRGHFSTLYDIILHTPMYIKAPGVQAGLHMQQFTRHVDLFPTVADYLKHPHSPGDGRSLWPVLTGKQPDKEPSGLMYFAGDGAWREKYWNWRAVRGARFKYMAAVHVKDGALFYLFDLQKDPKETTNLADVEAYRPLLHQYADLVCDRYPGWPHPARPEEWQPQQTEEEAELMMDRLRKLGYA